MGIALIKGMGLGAGLMYFFDPDRGRARRALVVDQYIHAGRALEDFFGVATRDLGNRAWGAAAGLRQRFGDEPVPDDAALVARVRATIGHHVSHPRAIEVAALGGHVVLRGPVLEHELEGLIRAVSEVPDVLDVADELVIQHGSGQPAPRAGERTGSWLGTIPPSARLMLGAVGAALAIPLVRRNPMTGLALGAVGLVLATRGSEGDGRAEEWTVGAGGSVRGVGGGSESGRPGGGRGRIDVTGRSGVYPASGPLPRGEAQLRAPAAFVRGQTDDQGRQVEGGSELTYMGGTLLSDSPADTGTPAGDQAAPGHP